MILEKLKLHFISKKIVTLFLEKMWSWCVAVE